MEAELAYYRRRSAEELKAADNAHDGKVRNVHLELGRRYGERVSTMEAELRRSQLHAVEAD